MKFRFAYFSIFFVSLFGLSIAFSASAASGVCPTDNGLGQVCSGATPYYCLSACRAQTQCPSWSGTVCASGLTCPANCATADSCGYCNSCTSGHTLCGSYPSQTCEANDPTPAGCSGYNQCTNACTGCLPGYEPSGDICVGASIRLDSTSLVNGFIKNSANALPFMFLAGNGNIGIATNTPETRLTVVGSGNYSIDAGNYRIGNIAAPVSPLDAVNKSYLESAIGTAQSAFWNLNGSNLYTASTTWNVGIGTTSPSSLFNAVSGVSDFRFSTGASALTPTMAVINTNTGGKAAALLAGTSGSAFAFDNSGVFSIMSEAKSAFTGNSLGTGSTLLRILANGNVGIATNTPTAKLYVNGTSIFNDLATFTQPVIVATPILGPHAATKSYVDSTIASATSSITTLWGGTTGGNVWNLNSGNVGIGTTNPAGKLHVGSGKGIISFNYGSYPNDWYLDISHQGQGGGQDLLGGVQLISQNGYASGRGAFTFAEKVGSASAVTRLVIQSGGNVGIGTSTPQSQLDVNGLIKSRGAVITLDEDVVNKSYLLSALSAFNAMPAGTLGHTLYHNGSAWTADSLLFNNGANIGIGTVNPQAKLHVAGDVIIDGTLDVGSWGGIYTGTLSAGNISAGTFGSNTGGGNYTFTGNLEFPELLAARTTYASLNDRLNGIVANYSSVISNSEVKLENFLLSTKVNTTNTTAYYNNLIGTIQNDHSPWSFISLAYAYGNRRSMGGTLIYGNKMYIGTYSYGIKILNLDTNTLEKQYWTASTPAIPDNYWHHLAYDPVNNDLYAGNNTYNRGMIKIDIDANTVTQFTTSNSGILSNNMGIDYSNCMEYYNGKIYFWPAGYYMQSYNVSTGQFTHHAAASGLPSGTCYSTEVYNNELHISTSNGFYIWNLDTDTLTKRYYVGGPQGLSSSSLNNIVYSSHQDPNDSDIVWLGGYYSWQKLSKTNGAQEFHHTLNETSLANYRWEIRRIGDQIWLGSYYGLYPNGYLVYDLNAEAYFVVSDDGKVIGNAEETSSYHFQPLYYNGYWYFANYSDAHVARSQLLFESSNVFETNVLITMTNDITMAKFNYYGGAGPGNNIDWYLSADNGAHWEGPVTPDTVWKFSNIGKQLKVRALMTSGNSGTTPVINDVEIAAYDGETWAGEGSNTVETEVLQARDSTANGLFGSLDLRLENIDTKINTLPSAAHNHDSSYLKLSGGTLSGQLTVNANLNANNILPNANNAFDLGASSNRWNDVFATNVNANSLAISTSSAIAKVEVSGGNIFINDAVISGATPKAAITREYLDSALAVTQSAYWNLSGSSLYASSTSWNVGIGINNPSSKLEVAEGPIELSGTTGYAHGILMDRGPAITTTNLQGSIFTEWNGLSNAESLTARAYSYKWEKYDGSDWMVINSSGSVGIGTTNPLKKLQVAQDLTYSQSQSGQLYLSSNDGVKRLMLGYDTTNNFGFIEGVNFGTSYSNVIINPVQGNVGIGTTTLLGKLSVSGGNIFINDAVVNSGTPKAAITWEYLNSALSAYGTANSSWSLNGSSLYASSTSWNVGIGTTNPAYKLHVVGKIAVNGGGSVFVGENAGLNDDGSDNGNVGLGLYALNTNVSGSDNVAVGVDALRSSTSTANVAIGTRALRANSSGAGNTAAGFDSLTSNTTGDGNAAYGARSLFGNTSGSNNVAVGNLALHTNTSGYNNVGLGYAAGRFIADGTTANQTGYNSIFLGTGTRANANGEYNQIVIGADAIGNGSNSVTLGGSSITRTILRASVGIGTTTPAAQLSVSGGNILINDAVINSGTPKAAITWEYLNSALAVTQSAYWNLSGSNLIASSTSWNIGIGTTNPGTKLEVNGSIRLTPGATTSDIILPTAGQRISIGSYGTISQTIGGASYIQGNGVAASRITNNYLTKSGSASDSAQYIAMRYDRGIWLGTGIGAGDAIGTEYSDSVNTRLIFDTSGNVGFGGTISNLSTFAGASMVIKSGKIGIGTTTPDSDKAVTIVGGNLILKDAIIGAASDAQLAATKGYVDSVINALPSGISSFVTSTPVAYNGSRGGYSSANALCSALVAGSHVCTAEEILNTINSGATANIPINNTLWISNGPPGYTVNANDCIGWTDAASTSFAPVWVKLASGDGFGALDRCNSTRRYACCK